MCACVRINEFSRYLINAIANINPNRAIQIALQIKTFHVLISKLWHKWYYIPPNVDKTSANIMYSFMKIHSKRPLLHLISWGAWNAEPLFTARTNLSLQDLVTSKSHGVRCCDYRIVPKFDRQLDSAAVDMPVKFQSDMTDLYPNLVASRPHEIWQPIGYKTMCSAKTTR